MIRDITIGQYYPVESVVHRLDPRTKLFGTLIYIISLFFADNLLCYAMCIRDRFYGEGLDGLMRARSNSLRGLSLIHI